MTTTSTTTHFEYDNPLIGLGVRVSFAFPDADDDAYVTTGTLRATVDEGTVWVIERADDRDGALGDIWALPEDAEIIDPFTDVPAGDAPTDQDETDDGWFDVDLFDGRL